MKKINTLSILLIGALMPAMQSCEKNQAEAQAPEEFCIPDSLIGSLTFDTVHTEMIESELRLTGKISFDEDRVMRIFPFVSGHITEAKVSLGDFVQKGQVLATVMSTDIAGYSSEYKTAEAELALAKKNLEVTHDMKEAGINSERDIVNAQGEYDKALSAFNRIQQTLKVYGDSKPDNGSEYSVKSPISGFIVEKNINSGMDLRADDSNTLFVISDLNDVWVTANVYESDIAKIKEGDQATVTTLSYPDKVFDARVEKISSVLNPETNTMAVRLRLKNPGYLLKPGMFANVTISFPGDRKVLTLNSSSILYDDNKCYSVRFKKRCDVDLGEVRIINTDSDKVFFESDSLHEGDCVIGRNNLFVFTALKKH
jgi:cobalt-zinc-cadmium efflux system membrane fusion protein